MSSHDAIEGIHLEFLQSFLSGRSLLADLASDIEALLEGLKAKKRENMAGDLLALARAWPNTRVVLAIDMGKRERAVGMATAIHLPPSLSQRDRWFIDHVSVLPTYRRRGIARALCNHLIATAFMSPDSRVELTSRNSNKAAHALYRGMGFNARDTTVFRIEN